MIYLGYKAEPFNNDSTGHLQYKYFDYLGLSRENQIKLHVNSKGAAQSDQHICGLLWKV